MPSADVNPWEQWLADQDPEIRALSESPPPADEMPVGDRVVPRQAFLGVLAEQVASAREDAPGPMRPDRVGAGMVAAAWRQIVFGQAQAVVRLLELSFEVEAQVNARASFEHAVALQGLAMAAEAGTLNAALTQLAGDAGRHSGRQLDELDRIDAASGETYRSLLDAARKEYESQLRPPGYKSRQIKDMFAVVSPNGALYGAYSRMSEASHAGLGSATPFLITAFKAGSNNLGEVVQVAWAETAALLCWSCCTAEVAMLQFSSDGTGRAARQIELLGRVGLVPG